MWQSQIAFEDSFARNVVWSAQLFGFVPERFRASSGISGTQRTAKSASASSGPNTQSPQVPFVPRQNLGVAIPAVDEDGFVAVRKGAKPKKKSSTGNVSSAPVAPEDDEFW